MGKVISTVGIVVGAVALAATGIGAIAAPALAGAMTIGGVSASTLLLASTALTTAGQLLTPRPKASPSSIDRLHASLIADTPRKMAFGRTALNTDMRYQEWWGRDQEYCSQVFVLASHHCEAVEEIWLDDKLAWTSAGGVQGIFSGYLEVQYRAQATTDSRFYAGWSGRWGANATFAGCATLYLQFKVTGNGKKGTSPFSSSITNRLTVIGKGARLPDPRFDSLSGGSGAVRVADQTTWAWAPNGYEVGRNPALVMLFYLLGWRIQNPSTGQWNLAVGCGVPASRIDMESFITAANLCDEVVQKADGSSEPRYRCDGTISEADDRSQVIAALETAMNGKLRDTAGRFSLQVLHNDLATPVVDFTDDDVLGDFVWQAGNDLNDRRNVMRGRYTNAAALYQSTDFPQVRLPSLDGIDRIDSIDLALVQSPSQAQRIAKQRLQRLQYQGTFAAEFNARGWAVKDGDIVRLTFSALGFDKKLFRVAEGLIDPTGVVPLVLVEENAALYAWDRNEAAAVVPAEPNGFNPLLLPIVAAIDEAGRTAEWPAITGEGKPEDNATVGAPVGTSIGDRPVELVLEQIDHQIDQIEPIKSDISAIELAQAGHADELAVLSQARVDMEAIQRQVERDAGKLDEALLRLLSESSRTREVLRDAGIVVDPVTGVVRIYAVDQVAERTNRVEVGLDAVRGTVSLKADSDWVEERIALAVLDPVEAANLEPIIKRLAAAELNVDGLKGAITSKAEVVELTRVGGRVTTAEQDIDALKGSIVNKLDKTTFDRLSATVQSIGQKLDIVGDTTSYSLNIRQARLIADDAATAALRGLLAGDEANRRQIVQAAEARQDIYTRLDGDKLTEAQARLALAAEVGAVRAMAVRETTARIDAVAAVARDVRALGVTSRDQAAAIGEVNEALIDARGGLARNQMTIRQVVGRADTSDEALLRALIAGDDASRARQAQVVQIQTEFATTLVANEAAGAVARQALLARMNAAEAAIVDVQRVLADNVQSLVERIRASEAVWRDPETGLMATRSRLAQEEKLSADRYNATGKAIEDLSTVFNDPVTGLPGAFSAIGAARETASKENEATAKEVRTLNSRVNDPTTGLDAAFSTIGDVRDTAAKQNQATAKAVETLGSTVNDPDTGLPGAFATIGNVREAAAKQNQATAKAVEALGSTVNDPDTGLPGAFATIGRVRDTAAKDNAATAKLVEQVRVKLGDIGEATVQDLIDAVVEETGRIMATRTVAIDVNGNIVGTQLVGAKDGRGSLNLINVDLKLGTGRVVFDNGKFMRVQGTGFGASSEFISWFGPKMDIAQCSRANAITFEAANGDAYFGGSLSAGTFRNSSTSSTLAVDSSVVVGPFKSNSRARVLVVSYDMLGERPITTACPTPAPAAPTVTVDLYRGGNSGGVLLTSQTLTGDYECDPGFGDSEPGSQRNAISGSFTLTDNLAGENFTYFARIRDRVVPVDPHRQLLTLISTEE